MSTAGGSRPASRCRAQAYFQVAAERAAVLSGLDLNDHHIRLAGRRTQHVDILHRARCLVVEYDGFCWHDGEQRERRDRQKTTWLSGAGYLEARLEELRDAGVRRRSLRRS